jgi:nucleoside-diphosphate-sugar epimerase
VIAVTGAAGPAGRALVQALLLRMGDAGSRLRPKQIIAIDSAEQDGAAGATPEPDDPLRAGEHKGLQWRQADIASPDVAGVLSDATIVVHLACADDLTTVLGESAQTRRLRAVRAAQAVSMAAAAVGAQRLIAVTSAMVFGARPENPIPLDDDWAGRAEPDDGLIGDLLEVERVLERVPRVHPGMAFSLIRPAALVGPGVDSAVTRHFEAPRLLVLRGASTRWQFCHLDDLASAIWTAIVAGLDGTLTVGSQGSLSEDEVEELSGMRRLEVPAGLAFSTAERLHRVGVLPTPATELAYVVHPWVVGSQRLETAGWGPEHGNEECLQELMDDVGGRRTVVGRRVDRRDAAMGAAGAAVALVGTAAILRQARSRQTRRRRSTLDP